MGLEAKDSDKATTYDETRGWSIPALRRPASPIIAQPLHLSLKPFPAVIDCSYFKTFGWPYSYCSRVGADKSRTHHVDSQPVVRIEHNNGRSELSRRVAARSELAAKFQLTSRSRY